MRVKSSLFTTPTALTADQSASSATICSVHSPSILIMLTVTSLTEQQFNQTLRIAVACYLPLLVIPTSSNEILTDLTVACCLDRQNPPSFIGIPSDQRLYSSYDETNPISLQFCNELSDSRTLPHRGMVSLAETARPFCCSSN